MAHVPLYIFFILFLTYVGSDEISKNPVQFRIYGGKFASNAQFPFTAYISYGRTRYCGASIIHKRWALTAAHCIRPYDNPSVTVGKVNYFQNGTTFKLEGFYIHENYALIPEKLNKGLEYVTDDIAVVRLNSSIEFDETVKPIELSTDTKSSYENASATIIGWGNVFHDNFSSTDLRYIEVRVLPMKECKKVWTYADKHLCTSNRYQKGVCRGDSGSPVVVDNLQIGVVSTTDTYCKSLKPDLHTKVVDYVPWIKSILRAHGDSLPYE